jgi:hypothetical protein
LTVIIVPVDSSYQATAAAGFSDGSSREVTAEVQWTSTNTSVAVVSDTGRVTPIAAGAAEIRGTYQTISGSAHLTVAAPPPAPPVASPPAAPPAAPAPSPAPPPPEPEIHRVTVRVLDALDRSAVTDAKITIVPAGHSEGRVGLTNGAGELVMTGAWGGSVTVRAQRDGYELQTVQRPVPDAITIEISLKPLSFTLSGTVEEAGTGDSPVPGSLRVEVVDGVNAGRDTKVQWDPQRMAARCGTSFQTCNPARSPCALRRLDTSAQRRRADLAWTKAAIG